MNAKTSTCTAFVFGIIAAVQPCWAQLIDPATQVRAPLPLAERRPFDVKNTGMSAEIIRPGGLDSTHRTEVRHVSPTVLEQIGKVKQSMPSSFGVH